MKEKSKICVVRIAGHRDGTLLKQSNDRAVDNVNTETDPSKIASESIYQQRKFPTCKRIREQCEARPEQMVVCKYALSRLKMHAGIQDDNGQ